MPSVGGIEAFGAFFKRYARTWQHAVATAALTAFGMLTFVDPLFAVLALLAYVLPPVVIYLRSSNRAERAAGSDAGQAARSVADDESRVHGSSTTEWSEPAWRMSVVPTDETLTDVAITGDRAYAVGTAGSVVCDAGSGWESVVVDGPDARSNALTSVSATGSGAVWFAGDAGAVGRIGDATDRHVSHSEPNGDATNIVGLAVADTTGGELVLLADGSGRLRRGHYNDGDLAWDDPMTLGSGSSLSGVVLPTASVGYACDTNQTVFRITDGGRTSSRVGVDAPGMLTGLAATVPDSCLVCDDSGVVTRYDGEQWTPERVTDTSLEAIAVNHGQCLASGSSGAVFENNGSEWVRVATPATVTLRAVVLGNTRAVAVGADGTIVERGSVRGL